MSGVNQFRQLFVVKSVDNDSTFIIDKSVNAGNFASKISSTAGLYVAAADADKTASTGDTADTDNSGYYKIIAGSTTASGGFNKTTKYFMKVTSLPDTAGEIEVNTDHDGNLYFSYCGQGGKVLRSDLIEPDQIVKAVAVAPTELNKGKQVQHSFFEVNESYFATGGDGEKEAGVAIAINFTNFGNGVNSIYPFSVFVKKFVPAAGASSPNRLVDKVVAAINDAKIVDLAGNSLITASINTNKVSGKNLVEITATPTGDYVAGKTDVYYPQFTVSVSQDDDNFISDAVITEFNVDTTVSNWDVASEMELAYVGSRINGGQTLPYNFPFNGNFKQMVEEGAKYCSIDIHYYKTNDPDFSQKSHGTITLLIKEPTTSNTTGCGATNSIIGKIRTAVGSSATATLDYLNATAASRKYVVDVI
jgi:hypothetical protein